ncbi:ROK family protein [Streptomyces sp. NPDC050256]|uniref:ROK family protein n=1 Tax=Streptomyces sp. NPDC050256 TaxID=3365607 RepID=UPI0037A713CE
MTSVAHPAPAGPVVGLDLGGTKIAAALLAADGTVLARHSRPTPAQEGAAAVLDALAAAAAEVDPARSASVLGIAAAGVIDPRTGMVTSATDSIRGWAGTLLGVGLANRTGYAVACDNDVRATAGPELAALNAEAEGHGSLLFAAIGTGVGGAVAADGRMLHGSAGIAGHLGHVPSPEAAGLPCTCGATGHLEVIASGPGIAAHYERLTGAPVDRLETVAARAGQGDVHAVTAITTGAAAAGHVLGGLANAFGPDRVVIGGGVPRIGPLYEDALRAAFAEELMGPLRRLVPQAPLLGHDAAVLGAASLTATLPLHPPGALR